MQSALKLLEQKLCSIQLCHTLSKNFQPSEPLQISIPRNGSWCTSHQTQKWSSIHHKKSFHQKPNENDWCNDMIWYSRRYVSKPVSCHLKIHHSSFSNSCQRNPKRFLTNALWIKFIPETFEMKKHSSCQLSLSFKLEVADVWTFRSNKNHLPQATVDPITKTSWLLQSNVKFCSLAPPVPKFLLV